MSCSPDSTNSPNSDSGSTHKGWSYAQEERTLVKRDASLHSYSGAPSMYLDPETLVLMYVERKYLDEGSSQDYLINGNERKRLSKDETIEWPAALPAPWAEPEDRSNVNVVRIDRENGTPGYQVEFNGHKGPVVEEISYLAVAPGGEKVVYLSNNGKEEPMREEIMFIDHIPGPSFSSIGSTLIHGADEWKETGRMPTGDGATDWVWQRKTLGQATVAGGALFTTAGKVVFIGSNDKLEETVHSFRTYSEQSVVIENEAGPELGSYGNFTVSPDGLHIAYTGKYRTGSGAEVYVDTFGSNDYASYTDVSNPVWQDSATLLYYAIVKEYDPGPDGLAHYNLHKVVRHSK